MKALKLGRRYRINDQGNKADGRVGTLESVINGEAWLMVGRTLAKAPASSLTDKGVVNMDLTPFRIPAPVQLEWSDNEVFG